VNKRPEKKEERPMKKSKRKRGPFVGQEGAREREKMLKEARGKEALHGRNYICREEKRPKK
jgi:hypothetical protein